MDLSYDIRISLIQSVDPDDAESVSEMIANPMGKAARRDRQYVEAMILRALRFLGVTIGDVEVMAVTITSPKEQENV